MKSKTSENFIASESNGVKRDRHALLLRAFHDLDASRSTIRSRRTKGNRKSSFTSTVDSTTNPVRDPDRLAEKNLRRARLPVVIRQRANSAKSDPSRDRSAGSFHASPCRFDGKSSSPVTATGNTRGIYDVVRPTRTERAQNGKPLSISNRGLERYRGR